MESATTSDWMPTVLIVDDEEALRGLVAEFLESRGFTCHVAATGMAALNLFARRNYDLIISDLRHPAPDGYELITVVRSINARQPVMIYTAATEIEECMATFRCCFPDVPVVTKPAALSGSFMEAVERALQRGRAA